MVVFGITKKEINLIESELATNWKNIDGLDFKYSYHFWIEIAKKCNWEALTLCLAYFKHLEQQKE